MTRISMKALIGGGAVLFGAVATTAAVRTSVPAQQPVVTVYKTPT
ncbi:MAG: hypothetical protein OER90_11460 [Gemmatimonadota bacterium]|nr:hypothetical protein [Gemmatimonadota bacterium]